MWLTWDFEGEHHFSFLKVSTNFLWVSWFKAVTRTDPSASKWLPLKQTSSMFYRSISRGPAFASDENTPKDLIVSWVMFFLVGVYCVLNPDLFPSHINITCIMIIPAVICLLCYHHCAKQLHSWRKTLFCWMLHKLRIKEAALAEGANDLSRRQDSKLDIDQLA